MIFIEKTSEGKKEDKNMRSKTQREIVGEFAAICGDVEGKAMLDVYKQYKSYSRAMGKAPYRDPIAFDYEFQQAKGIGERIRRTERGGEEYFYTAAGAQRKPAGLATHEDIARPDYE